MGGHGHPRGPARKLKMALSTGSAWPPPSAPTFTQNPPRLWERVGDGTNHWVRSAVGPAGGIPPAVGTRRPSGELHLARPKASPGPRRRAWAAPLRGGGEAFTAGAHLLSPIMPHRHNSSHTPSPGPNLLAPVRTLRAFRGPLIHIWGN